MRSRSLHARAGVVRHVARLSLALQRRRRRLPATSTNPTPLPFLHHDVRRFLPRHGSHIRETHLMQIDSRKQILPFAQ